MIRFRELLKESQSDTEHIRAALELFDLGRRKSNALSGLDVLEKAIQDQSIYNTQYNDTKTSILSALESAYSKARDEELYNKAHSFSDQAARSKFLDDYSPDSSFGTQSSKKLLDHYTKHAVQMPKCLKVVQGLVEIKKILDLLKPLIQKGRKPKEIPADAPQGFRKPTISYDAHKEVAKFLSDAASDVRAELEAAISKGTYKNVNTVLAAPITDRKTYLEWVKKNPQLQLIAQKVWTSATDRYDAKFIIDPDFNKDVFVKNQAVRIADDILAQFVSKNTSKLALIDRKSVV